MDRNQVVDSGFRYSLLHLRRLGKTLGDLHGIVYLGGWSEFSRYLSQIWWFFQGHYDTNNQHSAKRLISQIV